MTRRLDGLDVDVAVIQQLLDIIRVAQDVDILILLVGQYIKLHSLPGVNHLLMLR